MNSDPRQASVQVDDIPKDMKELVLEIEQLPLPLRARLEPIMQRVVDSTKRRRRILSLVQEALSQLRLDMKYLVFDLEATRRERDAYKQSLEGGSAE
ncbi:MAG: transcriptional regulator [Planctomycetales bacterium]|nr:transcriptional regulator [Planctomycetales bacterium]